MDADVKLSTGRMTVTDLREGNRALETDLNGGSRVDEFGYL
jgi:hypothetical protein